MLTINDAIAPVVSNDATEDSFKSIRRVEPVNKLSSVKPSNTNTDRKEKEGGKRVVCPGIGWVTLMEGRGPFSRGR